MDDKQSLTLTIEQIKGITVKLIRKRLSTSSRDYCAGIRELYQCCKDALGKTNQPILSSKEKKESLERLKQELITLKVRP